MDEPKLGGLTISEALDDVIERMIEDGWKLNDIREAVDATYAAMREEDE